MKELIAKQFFLSFLVLLAYAAGLFMFPISDPHGAVNVAVVAALIVIAGVIFFDIASKIKNFPLSLAVSLISLATALFAQGFSDAFIGTVAGAVISILIFAIGVYVIANNSEIPAVEIAMVLLFQVAAVYLGFGLIYSVFN